MGNASTSPVENTQNHNLRLNKRRNARLRLLAALFLCLLTVCSIAFCDFNILLKAQRIPPRVKEQRKKILSQCKYLRTPAGPPADFQSRTQSDRFVAGTKPVLLKNAKVWTGAHSGTEVVYGDVLLDKGLVQAVGYIPLQLLRNEEVQVMDVKGAWVTPGLVDLHSHIGVGSSPGLRGSSDSNSRKAPILPWLRAIDGLNTHDASYQLAMAGGVTTAQILPGSANNIGGQGIVIKLRPTQERSPTSMVIEPPFSLNGTHFNHSLTPRWRHMKHACGENPSRVYSQTRMDSGWNFRNAYDEARKLRDAQDIYCDKAEAGLWSGLGDLPESLQWEALADVLRGKVKLSVHCYEAVDLDGIVRLSNEFQFPVASFHHAGETYLVPDLLKKTWGGAPAIALFATNFRKKREAYRSSEFAPRVLAEHGIPVVMKSDHPVVNSRYLLNEAALAHYFGLNPALALASVTSTPANAAGLGHRIGSIRKGFDADVVVWDSHPLALGATPTQVYVDGIPQIKNPSKSPKPYSFQVLPETPDFDREAAETVKYEGLPPLEPRKMRNVAFTNVKSIYRKDAKSGTTGIKSLFDRTSSGSPLQTVLVKDGQVICINDTLSACPSALDMEEIEVVDLMGGSIAPALTTFGAPLGLVEIRLEPSTNDGIVYDALTTGIPSIVGGDSAIIRAVDGLQFGGRNTLLAYRSGVSTAITAPVGYGLVLGVSTAFAVGARNGLEKGAIMQDETAFHVAVSRDSVPSVSTQIAALRKGLFPPFARASEEIYNAFAHVRSGTIPLVVHVENADIMATLLNLKTEFEKATRQSLRLTFAGATEAHLLAREIGEANVSVVIAPSRPFPSTWGMRRILPGPPLTNESAIMTLLRHNVNVAVGVVDEYAVRNTRFDIAWAALESNGMIDELEALALASTNLEKALGLQPSVWDDVVAYQGGGALDFQSKVVGVLSLRRGVVDLF